MKKLTFLLLTSLALISCGDDDQGSGTRGPKPKSITLNSGNAPDTRTFEYDNKNRISKMVINGSASTFTYNESGDVDKMSYEGGFYEFDYVDGELATVTNSDGLATQVTMSPGGVYNYGNLSYTLNGSGDYATFGLFTISYGSKNGIFANVNRMHPLAMFLADQFSYVYGSSRRPDVFANNQDYPFVTTAEEEGLPTVVNAVDLDMTIVYE